MSSNKLITADGLAHLEANYLPFITDPTNHNIVTKTTNNESDKNTFTTEGKTSASNNLVLGRENKLTASRRNLVGGFWHNIQQSDYNIIMGTHKDSEVSQIEYTYKSIIAGGEYQVKGKAKGSGGDKSIYSSAVLGQNNVLQTGSYLIASAFLLGNGLTLSDNTEELHGCLITGRYNTLDLGEPSQNLLFAVGGGEDNTYRSNKLDITLNKTRIFNNDIVLNSQSGQITISTNQDSGVVQLGGCVKIGARSGSSKGRIYIGANWDSDLTEGTNAILVLGNGQDSNNPHNAIEIVQRLSPLGEYPVRVNERLVINRGMSVSGVSILQGELKVNTIKARTSTVISLGTKSVSTSDGLTYIAAGNDYNLANGFAQYSTPPGFLTENAFYSIRIEGYVNFAASDTEKIVATGTFHCIKGGLYAIPALDTNFGSDNDSSLDSVGGSVIFNTANDLNSIQVYFGKLIHAGMTNNYIPKCDSNSQIQIWITKIMQF